MGENDPDKPSPAPSNRTIQIDALTDVQLVDHVASESDADEGAAPATSTPPPLPRKQPAPPRSNGRTIALTLLAAAGGAVIAFLAVHFLFPSHQTAAPAPTYQAATTAGTTPPSAAAPPSSEAPAPATRRVQIDEELVIRAADPGE